MRDKMEDKLNYGDLLDDIRRYVAVASDQSGHFAPHLFKVKETQ